MKMNMEQLQENGNKMLGHVSDICESQNIPYFVFFGTLIGTIRHQGPIPWDYDIDIVVPINEMDRFLNAMRRCLPKEYWVDYRDGIGEKRSFPRIGISGLETEMLHIDVFPLTGVPDSVMGQDAFTKICRYLFVIWKAKTIESAVYYPDKKRRCFVKIINALTFGVTTDKILIWIDKQCNKYPYDTAAYVAVPIGTKHKNIYKKEWFEQFEVRFYTSFNVRIPVGYDSILRQIYGDYMTYPPKEEQESAINRIYDVKDC